jgi:hypothetical protein
VRLPAIASVVFLSLASSSQQSVEQTTLGSRDPAALVVSFDGLGVGFEGPQGTATLRNPSDNSLAVGPRHVMQTVNSRLAIFTKDGKPIYGPVPNNTVFKGFGGVCEARNNGDTVVRYDQLANRWMIVMPIFGAVPPDLAKGSNPKQAPEAASPGQLAVKGQAATSGPAVMMPANPPPPPAPPQRGQTPPPAAGQPPAPRPTGTYAMCYAISTGDDPMGPYYRYAFDRPLFPDYPRPAVWPDGYYTPTSTGDEVIQKHTCVAEREKMLKGQPAREQCLIIDGVNFLNNADLEGRKLPPSGAPNIILAAGGTQLKNDFDDDGIYSWEVHVDWKHPEKTRLVGPTKIAVAPYHYLCNGQLTSCVPQPDTDRKLDAQGDKLMARVLYRNVGKYQSIVAVHSVNTDAGGGGVRWYEFRLDKKGTPVLYQQGTYAPDKFYRWMGSPAIDKDGNIGIGYSFGGTPHYAGQRFAARMAGDPPGQLTTKETVLVEGEASQASTLRWEDYSQTAVDPSDDCTMWYVGDYLKKGATTYSTKIGAFRLPSCK